MKLYEIQKRDENRNHLYFLSQKIQKKYFFAQNLKKKDYVT